MLDKIRRLKKKLKKNQVIAIVFDNCGEQNQNDFETHIYLYHESRTIETGNDYENNVLDVIVMENCNGGQCEINEHDFDNIVDVVIAKKNHVDKMNDLTYGKTPTTLQKYVGIELELISKLSFQEMTAKLIELGIEKHVTLKDDGSIVPNKKFNYPHEICLLVKEKEMAKVVRKLCNGLKGNSTVNTSCGMHVHLDMRNRNPDNAYLALYKAQPLLYSICPRSRREGEYAQPVYSHCSVYGDKDAKRFSGINKLAYSEHRTLEVRIHSGTLDADKIINWVDLLTKIVNRAKYQESSRMIKYYDVYKKKYKFSGKLDRYLKDRIEQFKNGHKHSNLSIAA